MRQEQSSLSTAVSAVAQYNDLLSQMVALTDQLSASIRHSQLSEMHQLLDNRGTLCKRIDDLFQTLERSLLNLKADGGMSPGADRDNLRMAFENMQRLRNSILIKQAECESNLSAQLQQCRTDITAIEKRKELKTTYKKRSSINQAKFLDSKL